jgi:hypothetical protein
MQKRGTQNAKRETISLCVCLAIVLIPFVAAVSADDYSRRQALDVIHYDIHLEIKDADDAITAEADILFAFRTAGVREIPLDLAGMTVDKVTEDGRPAKFNHTGGSLTVSLAGVYSEGGRCRIGVQYHGPPKDGLFIKKNKFGDRTAFADNWPNRAHHWFPGIDHPYDKATVDFFVLAPDRYEIVANGILLETTSRQNGTKLTHWSEGSSYSGCTVWWSARRSFQSATQARGTTFRSITTSIPAIVSAGSRTTAEPCECSSSTAIG